MWDGVWTRRGGDISIFIGYFKGFFTYILGFWQVEVLGMWEGVWTRRVGDKSFQGKASHSPKSFISRIKKRSIFLYVSDMYLLVSMYVNI